MLRASLREGTPLTIGEDQPLLAADSLDDPGLPGRLQSSSDYSGHSGSSCDATSSSSAPAVQVWCHLAPHAHLISTWLSWDYMSKHDAIAVSQ